MPSWMKPSAQIKVHPPPMSPPGASSSMSWTKQQATKISSQLKTHGSIHTLRNRLSGRLQPTRLKSLWNDKTLTGIATMMRLPKPAAKMTQYRNLFINGPEAVRRWNYTRGGFEGGVIRKDIRQWMLRNWPSERKMFYLLFPMESMNDYCWMYFLSILLTFLTFVTFILLVDTYDNSSFFFIQIVFVYIFE